MTDLYIFRHGNTVESEKFKIAVIAKFFGPKRNTREFRILPKAIPALEKIGEYLANIRTDVDFCSPYARCVESARIVGKIAGKIYKTDERISELETVGEPFINFRGRVKNFLDEIQKKNYTSISICTHGAVISAIKNLATTGKFNFLQLWDYPPPGNLTIIKDGSIKIINFNKV